MGVPGGRNLGSFGKNDLVHSGLCDTSIANDGVTASPCPFAAA